MREHFPNKLFNSKKKLLDVYVRVKTKPDHDEEKEYQPFSLPIFIKVLIIQNIFWILVIFKQKLYESLQLKLRKNTKQNLFVFIQPTFTLESRKL